jgi:hypothetical protein
MKKNTYILLGDRMEFGRENNADRSETSCSAAGEYEGDSLNTEKTW